MDPLDNRTCRADGPASSLIFTNRFDILSLSTNGLQSSLVQHTRSAAAMALDVAERWVEPLLAPIGRFRATLYDLAAVVY